MAWLFEMEDHPILSIFAGTFIGVGLSIVIWKREWLLLVVLLVILGIVLLAVARKSKQEWGRFEIGTVVFIIAIVGLIICLCPPVSPFSPAKTVVIGTLYDDVNGDGEKSPGEMGIKQEKLALVSEYKGGQNTEGETKGDGSFELEVPDTPPGRFCLKLPDKALAIEENIKLGDHLVLYIGVHSKKEPESIPNKLSQTLKKTFCPMKDHIIEWVFAFLALLVLAVLIRAIVIFIRKVSSP